jgi:hypothetical protein
LEEPEMADLPCEAVLDPGTENNIRVSLEPVGQKPVLLTVLVSIGE